MKRSKIKSYLRKTNKKNKKLIFKKNIKIFFILIFIFFILFFTLESIVYFFDDNLQIKIYFKNRNYFKALELVNNRINNNSNDLFAIEYKARIYLFYSLFKKDYTNQANSKYLKFSIDFFRLLLINVKKQKSNYFVNNEVYFLFGFAYFLQNNYELALKYMEKGFKFSKNRENFMQFISKYQVSIFLNKEKFTVSPYGIMGYLSYKLGFLKKAINYFLKAIQVENDRITIYHMYLGILYNYSGEYSKAITEFKKVLLLENKGKIRLETYLLLSHIYFQKKNYIQAKKYIDKSQLINSSAEALYKLGLIYENQGKLSLAISQWKKALKLDSEHDLSRLRLMRFTSKDK